MVGIFRIRTSRSPPEFNKSCARSVSWFSFSFSYHYWSPSTVFVLSRPKYGLFVRPTLFLYRADIQKRSCWKKLRRGQPISFKILLPCKYPSGGGARSSQSIRSSFRPLHRLQPDYHGQPTRLRNATRWNSRYRLLSPHPQK